jgi:DNA-directed RNA polymerase subunit RPC12/RpoP
MGQIEPEFHHRTTESRLSVAIEFSCSGCGTTLRVPDEHAGKQARCPKCQSLNLIQAGVRQPDPQPGQPDQPVAPPDVSFQPPMGKPVSNPYAPMPGSVYPQGGIAGRAYQTAHRGSMILTLGIISLFCNFALIPGILAWVMGRADLRQMDAGRMDPEGRGTTQAGMILGMIMTIFAMIGVVIVIIYFVFVFLVILGAAANAR